ncbi:hypothetical protein ABIE18_003521 [Arthrobacter sp. 2762]
MIRSKYNGGKMGKVIRRVQTGSAVLMVVILGFFGSQPALATETNPVPSTEQPGESPSPEPAPIDSLPANPLPIEPAPVDPPLFPTPAPTEATPAPVAVESPVVEPAAPAVPPVVVPVAPPFASAPPMEPVPSVPLEQGSQMIEPVIPAEPQPAPSPTPTPTVTQVAAPPVVSADIAGPLKVALAPVAENNPIVQGLTILVLILLGVAYFRALRSKGVPGPRVNGK